MPLSQRPYVVDNDAVTHGDALSYLLGDVAPSYRLAVATGYLNLAGLKLLAEQVQPERAVRLLLGAAPAPGLDAELPTVRFEHQLAALRGERDFSRFPPSRAASILAAVDALLARDNVAVRRYTSEFLHGKAYLFGDPPDTRAALVSSANLTGPGLWRNRELGLADYNPPVADAAVEWFDRLWERSVDYRDDLRALLFPTPPVVTPEDVYLRALLELYGADVLGADGTPAQPGSRLELADFQRDGYERARAILARHHGVIYADGVGTGKTTVGLALIEDYAVRLGVHALVVAPAQLRGMWEREIDKARLPAQVVSYQELASDEQVGDPDRRRGRRLNVTKDSYRLVVVDEAHALRNADNTWYRAMTRLLGGEPKDVALLSATPINNTLWDLYNLVMLFARHDRALASVGVESLRGLFLSAGANARDVELLDPDRLFPVADAVSVRRDRTFIEENYPGATFPDGTPVRFPRPMLRTRRYALDAVVPGVVSAIAGAIGALTMARYRPSAYERGAAEEAREASLAGLLQSAVLKRFESSWAACRVTIQRMAGVHEAFLTAWDDGVVPSLAALRDVADEIGASDVTRWVAELGEDEESRSAADFVPEYRDAVAADLGLLRIIEGLLKNMSAASDPKLELLADILRGTPGKACVFASYAETVRYLDAHLDTAIGSARERVVVIGGETTPDERTRMLARFCPETVVEPGYRPPDSEVGLLLSTDVLSEGQNLQQASAVVSYDMPWNPQRVVQRNGRVIRLRSPHETVELTTMLPEPGELDALLRLEARIHAKIAAAGVFGMESAVLEDVEGSARNYYAEFEDFAERLGEGDESLLREGEDATGSFAGEQLRALLRRAAIEGEIGRLQALPWGIGAAFRQGPGVPSRGAPGTFFACRTRTGQRYWRYVRDADVDREELPMLRAINPGGEPAVDVQEDLEAAWRLAVADIVGEHNLRADPALAEDRLPPSQRFALGVLRDPAVALPAGAEDADELLSVPRDGAVRNALAEVQRTVGARSLSRDQAAERIVGVVREYGLTPVPPAPPLDPITEDDVGVVCWMRVLRPDAPARINGSRNPSL